MEWMLWQTEVKMMEKEGQARLFLFSVSSCGYPIQPKCLECEKLNSGELR